MNQESSLLARYRAQEDALSLEVAIAREVTMDVYHRLSSLADQVDAIVELADLHRRSSLHQPQSYIDELDQIKRLQERQCSSKGPDDDGYDITSAHEKSRYRAGHSTSKAL